MTGSDYKPMPETDFERLGGGHIAYVRQVSGQEARKLFPRIPDFAPNLTLWALLNADGTPILLADTKEAVQANAVEAELETVSVH